MATKMNEAQKFIHVSKYSRWIESENRRETSWEETSSRYLDFMRKRFEEKVPKKIWKLLDERVKGLGVVPSMRAVAMAGPALEENNIMGYNCSFVPFLDLQAPVELFYILMCGTGVGLSVENFFISQMPEVAKWAGDGAGVYVVEDSREGWANSLKAGLENWFAGKDIEFDYSRIRARGTRLKKTGGRASGPEPLKRLHDFCRDTICKAQGRKLNSLEWLDIANMIGDVVVVGGVRRASEISFSDLSDDLIRNAKNGAFPQYRCNSNNSAVYFNKPDAATFLREWLTLVESGTGERGIFNVHAIKNMLPQRREFRWDMRSNPCGEILLRPFSFCNLSEVIIRADDEFDDVVEKVEAAVWLGAMQSTLTKFPYLRPDFKKNCEEERLLGVSLTGQMDNPALMTPEKLTILKKYAIKTAKKASAALGINLSAAITTGKPSGCRPWYALTTTDNGILTMEDLFNDHPEFEQWAEYSGDAKVHYQGGLHPISKTYANGLSPIVKIDLTYGMEIKSTPNHKWLVQNRGWVEAEHLEPGDVVTVTPNIYDKTTHASFDSFIPESIKMRSDYTPILQPAQMNNDIAWLLGYLWGDGAMSPTKYKIRFIDENKYNLIKAQRIVKENFGVDSTINKASGDRNAYALDIPSKALWHWFIRNDVWKYFNDNIDIIPKCVRTSSKDDIISFFAGIIDADGWCGIDYSKDNLGRVTLTTAYEEFSKHVQHVGWAIGLAFGRSANVHGDNLQKQKKMFLMGLSKHYTAADSFAVLVKNSNKLSLFEKSPRFCGWSFAQPASKIKKNQVAGTVVAKTLAAPELTYDVEIPDVHAYTAGSIVSHNTVSQLADCASGAHPRYAKYYIRRYRLNSSDPVYRLMKDQGVKFFPENGQGPDAIEEKRKQWIAKGRTEEEAKMLVPDWDESQVMTWVCEFPSKAPNGAIVRSQVSAIEQLEWYLKIMENWCEHNQSISVYVRRDEWMKVGAWVYDHFDEVVGVSFIPYDDSDVKYKLAPYEEITKEEYEKRAKEFPKLDYSNLAKYELADETTQAQLLACTSGACELA